MAENRSKLWLHVAKHGKVKKSCNQIISANISDRFLEFRELLHLRSEVSFMVRLDCNHVFMNVHECNTSLCRILLILSLCEAAAETEPIHGLSVN